MQNFIRKWRPLLIILSLATAIRIASLLTRGDFWFDEQFSIHFGTFPSLAETLKYWILETNPPLYTIFLRLYLFFVDKNNEILVRLPSLIIGLASIALSYIFAKKIFSQKTAIISSTLMAFSVLHIFVSVEARVYALLMFLTISSFVVFYSLIIEQKNSKKMWLLYTVINILLLYAHLTSLTVVLIQFLALHFSTTDKKIIKNWYITEFISLALWSIWFVPSIVSKLNLNLGSAWYFETNGSFLTLILFPLLNSVDNNLFSTIFILLIFIGFYILVTKFKEIQDIKTKNIVLLISVWALLPVVLSSILNSFTIKYIIISYPAIFMLVGYILEKYIATKKSFLVFVAFIIIVFMPPALKFISQPIFSLKILNNYLDNNETEKSIIFIPFIQELEFKPQYKGKMPVISVYLKEDSLSIEERIARHNWHDQNTTKEDLYKWILSKTEKDEIKTIFLLSKDNKLKLIGDVLLENHWSMTDDNINAGLEYTIIKFDAPDYQTTPKCSLPTSR